MKFKTPVQLFNQLKQKWRRYYWQQARIAYYRSKIRLKSDRVELNPNLSWDYWTLGDILIKQGQWQQATQVLERGIELAPNHHHLYGQLAQAAVEQRTSFYQKTQNIEATIAANTNLTKELISVTHPHFQWHSNDNSDRQQPNYIIIGQQKCGTTFLYHYLCQHPQIIPALKKEIHFWSLNYELGLEWYRAHFAPISPEQNFITGEASPSYLSNPNTPKRIARFFPEVKLIVLLRNPVRRTISEYYMSRQTADEKRSLNEAVFDQIELDVSQKSSYIEKSKYFSHLRPWLEVFPKEQFLILKSEDLFGNTREVMDRVFDFLEVEPRQMNEHKKINSASYPEISPSQTKLLQDYFRPYNQKLETYLGREFNWYD